MLQEIALLMAGQLLQLAHHNATPDMQAQRQQLALPLVIVSHFQVAQ
jgi:hypothetical protein